MWNRREEVEHILLARLCRTTGVTEPVLVLKPLQINEGPFSALQVGRESTALMQVLFYVLHNVLVITEEAGTSPQLAEAILDQVLHLVMLVLVEHPAEFSRLAARETCEQEKTLVDVVCTLENHTMYMPYRVHAAWVLGDMEKHVPGAVHSRWTVLGTARAQVGALEAGKKREALLKKMKAQQASFADTFNNGSNEEDRG
ncbi:hypothetical protein K438DRAFT_1634556 [Mycena galopus ATCC 62051]|nr:hypothetical protein K438DRAFT_1634556 [Mycena galopus ATCC 62051]